MQGDWHEPDVSSPTMRTPAFGGANQSLPMSQRSDPDRLAQLQRLLVLDTRPEADFDKLTAYLASQLGVPITMVNLLDENRDWFKSCVGLPMSESPAELSFCQKMLESDAALILVEDTTLDARYADHPFVTGAPFIRFYAAARLRVAGQTVGTLCAYDMQPRQLKVEQVEALQLMASAAVELLAKRSVAA